MTIVEDDESTNQPTIIPSEEITLPVGYEVDSVRYRKVIIDELCGVDESLLANKKKTQGNTAKGLTLVLARAIQEITGIVPRKKNPNQLIDHMIPRRMYQVDRDYVFAMIQLLSEKDETMLRGQCPVCRERYEEEIRISELPVTNWPEDKPLEFEFELKRGYVEVPRKGEPKIHKKGVLRFPTGADQEAVAPMAQDNTGDASSAMLAACIKKLGDLEGIDQDIASRLKGRDRQYLFRLIREKAPGLKMWKQVRCYDCGHPDVIAIVDISAFFG